jgi:ClpP class serine protease
VTPGGEVGSIGVWMAHEDWSKNIEELGVKVTLISAGKYKTEGNPYEALPADAARLHAVARERLLRRLHEGRRPRPQCRDRRCATAWARAACSAPMPRREKMVDGVMTFDEVIKKMQRDLKSAQKGASRLEHAENELKILG